MTRTDFIDSRADVIQNIYTLYSYATGDDEKEREWAYERYRQGRCFVVEPFGNKLMFGPSRFCGYKENTWEKQCEHHGDGTETNDRYLKLKLYRQDDDPAHKIMFHDFLKEFGIQNINAKFFVPSNVELYHTRKCYFISPTHCVGQKEIAWRSFLDKGIAAIGGKNEDYTDYTDEEIEAAYSDDPTAVKAFKTFRQIHPGDIICCTHNNFGLWGIGIATSSYKHESGIHYAGIDDEDEEWTYSHYVEVKWLKYKSQGYIPKKELDIPPSVRQWPPYVTIFQSEISDYITNYLLKPLHDTMTQTYTHDRYIKLLKANRNLILTGAPGTGKTHLAKAIAGEMDAVCEFVQFHPSYDYTDFVEGLRPTPPDKNGNIGFERKDGIFKAFCKRALGKRTYSFEYLFNGLINDIQSGRTQTLDLRSGKKSRRLRVSSRNTIKWNSTKTEEQSRNAVSLDRLKQLHQIYKTVDDLDGIDNINKIRDAIGGCNSTYFWAVLREILRRKEEAENTLTEDTSSPKPHIFIIDEINRGEISKIFGELFFSIDPGYRGESGRVKTQYQNLITDESDPFYKGFYVPENVYIIGTMNDIDRSVESMDFAMRRRFAWEEVRANENTGMLDDLGDMREDAIERMNRLNKAIWDEETGEGIEGLNRSFHIGGSYFRKLSLYLDETRSNREEAYRHLWDNHLSGVLFEYLRGTVNADEYFRKLKDVYFNVMADDEVD